MKLGISETADSHRVSGDAGELSLHCPTATPALPDAAWHVFGRGGPCVQ
jgi:hypothetical protein